MQGDGQCGSAKDKFCLSWQIVPEELPMLLKGPRARYVLAAIMPVKSSLLKFFARLCAMSIIRLELEPTLFSAINWTGATSIACGYPFVGFIVATKLFGSLDMQLSTYLNFTGTCEEAVHFYAEIRAGEVRSLLRWSDMPGRAEYRAMADKVMHASLRIGEHRILGADSPLKHFSAPAGFRGTLNVDSVADAERIFTQLCDGGTATMGMGETFFARRFGMATDRFGIPWMVVACYF